MSDEGARERPAAETEQETLRDIYERLFDAYGPQHWWPGDSAFEIIVGAILTQSASWTNVEKALAKLKIAGALSPEGIGGLPVGKLAELIQSSGYYNAKARKLKAFVALLNERFGGDLEGMLATPAEALRAGLLSTYGIGPETADSIILYAARQPVFVIDAYTRRTLLRLSIVPESDTYEGWQQLFTRGLPTDAELFNEYHALIVRHGKDVCRRTPLCGRCPLVVVCPIGTAAQARARNS
jgi:endonuclease-3 related protein